MCTNYMLTINPEGETMSFSVLGTGMYVPEKIVTNDDLSTFLDTNDEWITQRVGIKQRYVCTHETAADLAIQAAKNALENSGVTADELDLIIGATVSGETICPSIACYVQAGIGAKCPAYDINAACSAFLFELETAAGFFARGFKKILVVGAERMSRIIDWKDRSTAVIFGDGAGAVVLGADSNSEYESVLHVEGGDSVIKIPQHIGNSPFFENEAEPPYTQMAGQETFRFAVTSIVNDIHELLEKTGHTLDEVKWIVPHQANKRIIDAAAKRLKMTPEQAKKMYVNIDHYGNTSSASIPIALDELNRAGKLQKGDLVLLTAFGGGLASGATLFNW